MDREPRSSAHARAPIDRRDRLRLIHSVFVLVYRGRRLRETANTDTDPDQRL